MYINITPCPTSTYRTFFLVIFGYYFAELNYHETVAETTQPTGLALFPCNRTNPYLPTYWHLVSYITTGTSLASTIGTVPYVLISATVTGS